MKYSLLILTLLFISPVHSESFITRLFLNKVPLKAEDRKEISAFFQDRINVSQFSLNCFQNAFNKQKAMACARETDIKVEQIIHLKNIKEFQNKINKMTWNKNDKQQLIQSIKLNIQNQQKSINCISKAKTVGALGDCFEGGIEFDES